jgi:hypothetical protein
MSPGPQAEATGIGLIGGRRLPLNRSVKCRSGRKSHQEFHFFRETIVPDGSAAVQKPTNHHHPDLKADSPARPIRAHGPRSAKKLRRQRGAHCGKR